MSEERTDGADGSGPDGDGGPGSDGGPGGDGGPEADGGPGSEGDPEADGGSDADDAVREAREEVIEAMERTADIYGIKRSYGRLYGILFFAEKPLSLDELVEESGYAKSTVSTAMTALDKYHMVHRRSVPGEGKKAYYEAERDFWYVAKQLLNGQGRREITIMNRALDDAIERLEDADGGEQELERLRELETTYDRFERFVDVVTGESLGRLTALFERLTGRNDSSDRE